MPVPDDPQAFIEAAERGINERDLQGTAGVYADDAFLQTFTDGAEESFRGAEQVRRAWAGYLDAMDERGFRLAKTLVSTSAETSVLTAMSRSVPDRRIPLSVVSTRMLASTGNVVFDGMLAVTAANPSCSFSRAIVKRIPVPRVHRRGASSSLSFKYKDSSSSRALSRCGETTEATILTPVGYR